jgi:hypothetical protein
MAGGQEHWDGVYGARSEDELTWFEATPSLSLELVKIYLQPGDAFIYVGAGASRLVDALLGEGLGPLTILDLSCSALDVSKQRLGLRGDDVVWIEVNVTSWLPSPCFCTCRARRAMERAMCPRMDQRWLAMAPKPSAMQLQRQSWDFQRFFGDL